MTPQVNLASPEMADYVLNDHGPMRLLCEGIAPCVVRSNKAGQLVWAHLEGTGLFHLMLRPANAGWQQYSVGMNSPFFSAICRVLGQ